MQVDNDMLLNLNQVSKPKPVVDDYWGTNNDDGFGDDFDQIPDAMISDAGSESQVSSVHYQPTGT